MKMDIYGKIFFTGEIIAILLVSFYLKEYIIGVMALFLPIICVYVYKYNLKSKESYWGYWIIVIFFTYIIHTIFDSFNSYSTIVNLLFYSWVIFWPSFLILHSIKIANIYTEKYP